ncbi:MAG: holo-ACP synthase [Alcanivoracaceae bacterium]|jgi:holo-[acyl-carrier protein] synthase|nr:holo-ACP synthase [Alcanivoracaceae bacterium]
MICGLGTDIVAVSRVARVLQRHGDRFARRLLGPLEYPRFASLADEAAAAFLARRFAAKEAALKALGTGLSQGIRWHDVQVDNDPSGRPRLQLDGAARQRLASLGASRCHVSISDEKDYVVAFIILESD